MKKKRKSISSNTIGALITLIIVAAWGAWVVWFHMTRPMGIEHIEILFLAALVPVYLILIVFYSLRKRWSYLSGIIVMLGLFAGLVKSLLDRTFFFSFSIYNILVFTVLLAALLCIYFSIRSFFELSYLSWVRGLIGVVILIAVSASGVFLVQTFEGTINSNKLRWISEGIQERTGGIEDIDERIEALMSEGEINSAVAAIVVGDKIIWTRGYGDKSELDRIYDIGSITKTFIATAIMQLHEKGLIGLDDNVNKYLPFNVRHPDYPEIPITIQMLLANRSCLAHTSELYRTYLMGPELRNWGLVKRDWDYSTELNALSYEDFMSEYLEPGGDYYEPGNWTDFKPGTEYVYSTPGFDLLGYIIETVSGQSIDRYMHDNIFDPLQMTNTTATPLDNQDMMAIPYERWYGILSKSNIRLPLTQRLRIGGGGLYSTVGDLSNFLIAHMNQGKFKDYQLLSPGSIELMHTQASRASADFMQVGYGLGWNILQETPRQVWDITFQPRGQQGHGGRSWGYSGAMYMVEGEGTYGYVFFVNNSMVESLDEPWALVIQNNIQDLILQEAYRIYRDQ